MALRISGENYELYWSEDEQKWVGITSIDNRRVRVFSDENYEYVITWLMNHLDNELTESLNSSKVNK